jgi:hypothetical protein
MIQHGQVFELKRRGRSGEPLRAYRYRVGGRGSRRVQRGGFLLERDAGLALEHELDRVRRERGISRSLTVAELVQIYLDQHDVQPTTIAKLRWLLGKAIVAFGQLRLGELSSKEIAAWRMTLPPGHRFEATQALRQVLHRAVAWGMLDSNPAKVGVDNPTPRRKEQRPFESWAELEALAAAIGPRYGDDPVRPGNRTTAGRNGSPSNTETSTASNVSPTSAACSRKHARCSVASARAREALERLSEDGDSPLLFPGERGGYLDIHHFRTAHWRPAQFVAGIKSLRASTISGTPSRPSLFVPASRPSTSPVTWAPA